MINAIISGLMSFIISVVNALMLPIDLLIQTFIPDLNNALTSIGNFLAVVGQSLGWGLSVLGLSSETWSLIVLFFVFKLTAPLVFYSIKLALAWYDKLKP